MRTRTAELVFVAPARVDGLGGARQDEDVLLMEGPRRRTHVFFVLTLTLARDAQLLCVFGPGGCALCARSANYISGGGGADGVRGISAGARKCRRHNSCEDCRSSAARQRRR